MCEMCICLSLLTFNFPGEQKKVDLPCFRKSIFEMQINDEQDFLLLLLL